MDNVSLLSSLFVSDDDFFLDDSIDSTDFSFNPISACTPVGGGGPVGGPVGGTVTNVSSFSFCLYLSEFDFHVFFCYSFCLANVNGLF